MGYGERPSGALSILRLTTWAALCLSTFPIATLSAQTFNASSGLMVGLTGGHQAFPILTGNEQWKPGQVKSCQ